MHANSNRRRGLPAAIAILTLLTVHTAAAAPTAEQKCEAGKNDTAGKYAACLAKANKGLVTTGDTVKYDAAVLKCQTSQTGGWSKLENAAVSAGTTCPSTGDQADIAGFLDACVAGVAAAVGGDPLLQDPVSCNADLDVCEGDLATCDGDLATCDGDFAVCDAALTVCEALDHSKILKTGQSTCYNDAGSTIACAGSGQDGQFQAGDAFSYTDNGNGTITDNVTGLMWEKLSDDGSIHDKDTTYSGMSGAIAKAASLNGASFAGHNDWRVPNRRELFSLSDPGRNSPAINPIFNTGCVGGATVLTGSCTKSNIYWTSTTYLGYPLASWKLNFDDGDVYAGNRTGESHYARLVRTAN